MQQYLHDFAFHLPPHERQSRHLSPLDDDVSIRVPMPEPRSSEGPERFRYRPYLHYTDTCHCCRFYEV